MTVVLVLTYVVMAVLLAMTALYRRFLLRPSPIDPTYRPKVALLLAVRGSDPEFEQHIESLFALDYPDYEIVFGVAERRDEAYPVLAAACERHPGRAQLVVTGLPWACSEKIHNVLGCLAVVSADTEVLVVIDADIQPAPLFLQRLVTPLRDPKVGVATGFRWLVATEPSLPRLVATMTNAGTGVPFWFSHGVWGGVMAMRREVFTELDVAAAWRKSLSEDSVTREVMLAGGYRVAPVADTLAVSHQDYTWSTYWEFLVRQLTITRIYNPSAWWQGLALYLLTGLVLAYGVVGTITWIVGATTSTLPLAALPLAFLYMLQGWLVVDASQRAIARRGETIPFVRLTEMPIYVLAVAVGLAQLVASGFSRWIVWRGVVYHMHRPDRTVVYRTSHAPTADAAPRMAVSPEFAALLSEWAAGNGASDDVAMAAPLGTPTMEHR